MNKNFDHINVQNEINSVSKNNVVIDYGSKLFIFFKFSENWAGSLLAYQYH